MNYQKLLAVQRPSNKVIRLKHCELIKVTGDSRMQAETPLATAEGFFRCTKKKNYQALRVYESFF